MNEEKNRSIKLPANFSWDTKGITHNKQPLNELLNNVLMKLWENPNPSGTFKAQNITLSSADYDYLIWFYKGHAGWMRLLSQMTLKGYGIDLISPFDGQMSDGINWKIANFYRRVNRIDDITFDVPLSGMVTPNGDAYSENGISDGHWCIPVAIYGGKFIK